MFNPLICQQNRLYNHDIPTCNIGCGTSLLKTSQDEILTQSEKQTIVGTDLIKETTSPLAIGIFAVASLGLTLVVWLTWTYGRRVLKHRQQSRSRQRWRSQIRKLTNPLDPVLPIYGNKPVPTASTSQTTFEKIHSLTRAIISAVGGGK